MVCNRKPIDRSTRKTITELLAKEGYVPKSELDTTRITMKRDFDKEKEQTEFWMNRAKKKSKQLAECGEFLSKVYSAIDRQRDEELCKRIGSFLAVLSSKVGV